MKVLYEMGLKVSEDIRTNEHLADMLFRSARLAAIYSMNEEDKISKPNGGIKVLVTYHTPEEILIENKMKERIT